MITSGTPTRVTKLELDSESLTGVIPTGLGSLFELTHLKLNSNTLTGSIPRELGWLYNLEELKLSGNSLTGCIPIALEDVSTNDLSSLNLLYCRPPAPESVSATQTETSITVNWGAVSNTTKYRLEYREALPIDWTVASETLTTTTHSFPEVGCGTPYQFRVSAFGSGTTYDDEWSLPSQILNAETDECATPTFDEEEYAFTVSALASTGTTMGTVSATDPNDDSITYSITAGNTGNKFAINRRNGEITVARNLSDSASVSFSLTVEASDGANNVSTTVEITVSGPEVSLHGLPDSMEVFDQVWFSLGAQHLNPARTYSLRLTTDSAGIVLHNTTCGAISPNFTISAGSEGFSRTVALHACAVPGGTITATLMEGAATVDTTTWDVIVTVPATPRLPSIEIQDLAATIENGQRSGFRVRAFYLVLTDSYTVRVTTENANLGFDDTCTDRQDDGSVGVGNVSAILTFNLYACVLPGGTVTATLLQGTTVMDTATWNVTVTEPPPTPSVEITGLASTLAEGQNDAFEVVASHLTAGRPFFIEVTTSDGTVGFDSACDSRFTELAVPLESETGTLSTTLYACATPGGTVTATLFRWSTTMDTATLDVTVVDPPEGPPSAPQGMDASLADGTFSLSWTVLNGATNYEPQYSTGDSDDDWTALPTTAEASASFSPTDGPACGTTYKFRVRAFGDGTFFVASWGTPSDPDSVTTEACNIPPEFDPDSYTFSVAENGETGTSVGSVTAIDDDTDDELSYSITSGNTGNVFDMVETTGAITVAGALDHETTASYTLIVGVDDGREGTDTATVTITVTDVAENTPPAPENLSASLTDDTFSISWDTLSGSANYEPQYRTGDSDDDWMALPTTTGTSATFSPTDGPACGTTYGFRVRAYGDAMKYIADWGMPSDDESVTTDACNVLPEFDPDSYTFSVAENASSGTAVGTVIATDDDTDDELSYVITSGNTGDVFDISETIGAITVSGALDHETTASYTLIVEVDDGRDGVGSATVTITVTDVAENTPPAPENLSASLPDDTFSISWDTLSGAANYEPQYRTGDSDDDWMELPTTTGVSTTFSPTDGPACATTYDFRVRAYGDGTKYIADWGTPSATDSVTTDACNVLPEFDPAVYAFSVAENAATGTPVGTVSATDDDTDDELSYAITSGNTGDVFDIGETTGAITVSGALDHETTASYTLIVGVDDGREGTDTATVTITVTDVAENTPPAPENLSASFTDDTFSISWDTLSGAANYEPQYRTGDSDDDWMALPTTTGTSATFSPTGGPACGTTYGFRVRAYGDAIKYIADWGMPSDDESVTTDACNVLPEFDPDSYTFSVAENASPGTAVGAVIATDDDTDDELSYSITSGNTGDVFDIGETTGAITVSGALDHETTASYTLTVEVDDGRDGVDSATVTIAVTNVAENTPPSPENLSALLTDDTFSISWDALSGAANYEPQYRTGDSDDDWMALPTTTGTSATFSPTDGPACATTYDFRVRAYGDAITYIADWGTPSDDESVTTDACVPPEFDPATYTFSAADNVAVGASVGTVTATDENNGDTVSYTIVDADVLFSIGSTSGEISVNGALDYDMMPSYTLTVQATDRAGLTVTATVTVTVIAVPRQGERELWNGTLTAGPMTIGRADAFGYTSGVNTTSTTTEPSGAIEPSGTMQNATFEYGGQTYTIELAAYVHAFNGAKLFFVGLAERPLPSDTTLVAYVNGHRLSSWQTTENIDTYNYYSDASNFTVINGQVVSLSLYKTNPSDDSTLSSLTLSTGTITPAFDAGTTSYSATVSSTATSITITAEAMSDYATVDVSPSGGDDPNTDGVEITVGDQPTTVTVTVTAEDGSTTDYTLTITRESA